MLKNITILLVLLLSFNVTGQDFKIDAGATFDKNHIWYTNNLIYKNYLIGLEITKEDNSIGKNYNSYNLTSLDYNHHIVKNVKNKKMFGLKLGTEIRKNIFFTSTIGLEFNYSVQNRSADGIYYYITTHTTSNITNYVNTFYKVSIKKLIPIGNNVGMSIELGGSSYGVLNNFSFYVNL